MACKDRTQTQNQFPEEFKNCPRVKFDHQFDKHGDFVGLKPDEISVECQINRRLFSHRTGHNPVRATFYFQALDDDENSGYWALESLDSERTSASNRGPFSKREFNKIFSLLLEENKFLFVRKRPDPDGRMIVKFEPEYWRKLNEVSERRIERAKNGEAWRPQCDNLSDFYDCSSFTIGGLDGQKFIQLSIPIFKLENYIAGSLKIRDRDTHCEVGSLNYRVSIRAISEVANRLFKQPDELTVKTCIFAFEGRLILNDRRYE